MVRLSRNWFVLVASGWISLSMRMEIKMEIYYQKNFLKEQKSEQQKPEVSIPLAYETKTGPEDKERILKSLYSTVDLLEKILYETKQKYFRKPREK